MIFAEFGKSNVARANFYFGLRVNPLPWNDPPISLVYGLEGHVCIELFQFRSVIEKIVGRDVTFGSIWPNYHPHLIWFLHAAFWSPLVWSVQGSPSDRLKIILESPYYYVTQTHLPILAVCHNMLDLKFGDSGDKCLSHGLEEGFQYISNGSQ